MSSVAIACLQEKHRRKLEDHAHRLEVLMNAVEEILHAGTEGGEEKNELECMMWTSYQTLTIARRHIRTIRKCVRKIAPGVRVDGVSTSLEPVAAAS